MRQNLTWVVLFRAVIVVTALFFYAGNVEATPANGFSATTIAKGTLGAFEVFNHAILPKRTGMIAVCLLSAFAMPSPMLAQGYGFTFDPPGSTSTNPNAINAAGAVTGYYEDANHGIHGFVRDRGGNITSFDAPGASRTVPTGIRPNDDIVGYFSDQNGAHGFVRDHQGDFTTIDVPGVDFTSAWSVNSNGEITGPACCIGSLEFPLNNLGYVRDHQGSITTFYGPSGNINPHSINASKAISGDYIIDFADLRFECFLRSPDGDITSIVFPGSVSTGSCVLNSSGLVAGSYCDSRGEHGFLRDDKGAYTSFDPPGAYSNGECFVGTQPTGINDAATIIGTYYDSQFGVHGFLRARTGEMTNLDVLGIAGTYPAAINDAGVVTGNYAGKDYMTHGFVWKPQ